MPNHRDTRISMSGFLAAASLMVAVLPFAPNAAWATTPAPATEGVSQVHSRLGGYMAGRLARGQSDTQSAAQFYGKALSKDAGNEALTIHAFDMEATEGNWARVESLAADLKKANSEHRMSRLFLGLKAFKDGKFAEAEEQFKISAVNPVGELTALLARAWSRAAESKVKEALDLIDTTKQPDWAQALIRYHRALIADVGGRKVEARSTFERLFAGDQKSLRSTLAYAQSLSNAGDNRAALASMKVYFDRIRGDGHPTAVALQKSLQANERSPLLVATASQGLAEALFGLGEALAGEGGVGPGAIFLQYSLYLEPRFPFALAALANVYEGTKRYDRAIEVYELITPGTPLEQAIDIRKAYDLNSLERVDDAKALLEQVAERDPQDLKPLDALGSIMRAHKRYDEAIEYYTRAINIIKKPEPRHWQYFYARGTSYERVQKWPLAEADLQQALKLSPDEATVLNYLGYSWVDQNRNLKQGMQLIEKAVRAKPDDGYIVDSLGWAHYRTGNFKEAVKWLERAVELRPEDPILNDHLGDALWRVGREREAYYQWNQALTLKPEPEDKDKIDKKIKSGLPALAKAAPAPKKSQQVQRQETLKKRVDNRTAPGGVQQ